MTQANSNNNAAAATQAESMNEAQFRVLCDQYGGPDEIPCDAMPENIAATLSMADRFFDEDAVEDAVAMIREAGLFSEPSVATQTESNLNADAVKAIVAATLAEFAADEERQIIDCEVKEGCVMDLEGPAVFEVLASYRGENLRMLGNGCDWQLSGREAAIQIATERVFELCDQESDEYEDAANAVLKAVSEISSQNI